MPRRDSVKFKLEIPKEVLRQWQSSVKKPDVSAHGFPVPRVLEL